MSHFTGAVLGIVTCAGLACAPRGTDRQSGALDSAEAVQASASAAHRCYRSSASVLLGPPTRSGQQAQGPGWLRLEGLSTADSGLGELVDANRSGLGATWHRVHGDSVSMRAGDDFLHVALRLAISDSAAVGPAEAWSDAALERDSTGVLRDLRREWGLRASRASCDSMPVLWSRGPPRSPPDMR